MMHPRFDNDPIADDAQIKKAIRAAAWRRWIGRAFWFCIGTAVGVVLVLLVEFR